MRDCLKKLGLRVAESVDTTIPRVTPMYVVSPFKDKVRDVYLILTSKLGKLFEDSNDAFILLTKRRKLVSMLVVKKIQSSISTFHSGRYTGFENGSLF